MAEGNGGKSRMRNGRVLIFVLVPLLLAAGAATGYWFGAGRAGAEAAEPEPGPVFSVGSIMTNLGPYPRPVYIHISVELEVDGDEALEELEGRSGAVRDRILRILRAKSPADLDGSDGMHELAAEIRDAVNQMLTSGAVREVYFSEFIIQ